MAQKDYVQRSQAKKQAAKRSARNSSPSTNAPVPWLKVGAALCVVGLFIFGLYRLGTTSDVGAGGVSEPLVDRQNNDGNDLNAAQMNENTLETVIEDEPLELEKLPVLGEEEWAYIDSLPDYSVEVDAIGPKQSSQDSILQCGSFRTIERAETLRAKIAFQGLESRIIKSDGRNGIWYRVVLGPYERKREAERQRHQLRSANINECKIW